MIFRLLFLLLLLPNLAFGATATATLTINVAPSTTLVAGTYVLADAAPPVDAVDATANPPTAPTATYLSPQQWIWDGTRLDSVSRKGSGTEFLADGNSGLPILNSTGDTWTAGPILVSGSKTPSWTFQNTRTGNYLTIATGTGTLSMLSSGTQTPTTWVTASGATIAPTTIPLTTGTTGTVATFTCLNGSILQPCDTTQTWSASGLPAWLTLNASTGVLTTNSTPIVGSYTFTVSYGPYGPQTVSLTVTTSATLANGNYTLGSGGLLIAVGGTLGTTPAMFANNNSINEQWIWDSAAATWKAGVYVPTFPTLAYLNDNNSGLPLVSGVIDTWSVVANGVGWNIKNLRTNNYLTVQTGTGTLSMIPSGTQTPTVWTASLVTAPPPQPSATLSASPTSVTPGNSSTLTWSSTNASGCSGTNFSTGTGNPTAGTASVSPATTTTYSVNCPGAAGTTPATANAMVTVTSSTTATLTASPISVASGGSSTLTWSSTNALTCAGTGFSTGGATSGSVSTGPLTTNPNNYSINCSGAIANASVTVQTGGAGACPGGSSGFVPAGYNCVVSSTDEFNGSSVDTSKWILSGTPGGQGAGTGIVPNPSGGYVSAVMTPCCGGAGFNGSTSMGMVSKFPIPDAPMYLEFRRRHNSTAYLMQFWTNNCPANDGDCVGEETDIDMGLYNGCGGGSIDPGANNFGICSGMFSHNNDNGPIGFDFTIDGPEQVYQDGVFHIIGLWRQPNTVSLFVDGVHVKDYAGFDNRWTFPSLNRGANSDIDHIILNLFCASSNGCPTASIDWDYIRVYTPSGLPNGY